MRACGLLGLCASLLLALTTAAVAADYEIKIQRPFQAGQSFAVSATDTYRASEREDLPNGTGTRLASFRRITLEADVHVDKLDAQGGPAVEAVVLKKLTLQTANADPAAPYLDSRSVRGVQAAPQSVEQAVTKVVLEPGTELTLTYTGAQPAFALKKGGLLSDEALAALQQGFRHMAITDALYGARDRKKIGDSWPIDKTALPADKTDPRYVDPALITGTITLQALRTLAGVECLQIDGTMVTKDFPLSGVAPREATATVSFSCNLPTALDRPPVAWSMKSATHVVTEDKPLGQGTVVRTVDSDIAHDATWVPKP